MFNTYVVLVIWPLRMLGQIIAQAERAAAAAGRVAEVLATDPQIVDHPHPRQLPARTRRGVGEVRFDAVTFGYAPGRGTRARRASTSSSQPGESIALVGATGSRQDDGREADPALLRRRPADASRIDGVDVRDLRVHELRSASASCSRTRSCSATRSGRTSRSPTLTRRTKRCARASRLAGAHDFIAELPDGYDIVHRRAWLLAVGWTAPAHRDRARDRGRPARADPRRRDRAGRSDEGARDPRRPRGGDAGSHDDRDRAPAGDDRARRPGGAARRTAGWSRKARTTRCSRERALPRVLAAGESERWAAPTAGALSRCGAPAPSARKTSSIGNRPAA